MSDPIKSPPPAKEMHSVVENIKEAIVPLGADGDGNVPVNEEKLVDLHGELFDSAKANSVVTDRLHHMLPIDQLLIKPNVVAGPDLATQIMQLANKGEQASLLSMESTGSTVVQPGKIGIITYNGRVQVAGPGRWSLPNPRAQWVRVQSTADNPIIHEDLTIVRVQQGQYGLAVENGSPVLLSEGIHVRNSRLFKFLNFQAANQKYIKHGTIHLIIVPSSELCLIVEENKPKILKTGSYVIDNKFFSVEGFVPANQEHVQHQTVHIIRVPKGKVALITEGSKPALLPEGVFIFDTQVFSYSGLRAINEGAVVHGTITRFRVRNGEIGMAWHNNRPIFIEQPDFFEVDSSNFTFVKCVPASDKEIVLGSRKRISVYDGEVGISYINGKLDILQPKTHHFDAVERIFIGFLSTRQQSLDLVEEGSKDPFLRCETKDFVEIGLKAAVFYKIADPYKALMSVGSEEAIAFLIAETSVATIQSIMRSTTLNQVAQSSSVHAVSETQQKPNDPNQGPSAPLFFDKVHDDFISKLHDSFRKQYGLEIANIRIESFKIMNHALAENISQQAIITAQTETKLANLLGQHEISTADAEREAAVTRIKTQAMARQIATEVEAKNNAIVADATAKATSSRIVAEGEAEALLIKAQAEANMLIVRAEAEAKAIELKAEAERKSAEELSATPLGQQLALLNIQATMVTQALAGVAKVLYLPSNANLADTPLQLFGMGSFGSPFEPTTVSEESKRK